MTVLQSTSFGLVDSILLEIFLTAVIVILLGAAGYLLLFCSILDDRRDARRKHRANRTGNPWDRMIPQEEVSAPRDYKHIVVGLILLGLAIVAIIALVFVVSK
ncbi:MAG: hypothetical protein IJW70_02575 [Clostridia bacterium]|nr:hypothetical protein [Clostridia bacterium]